VRVLIDYRPALRERSGVGEYTHQLVRALAQMFTTGPAPALALTAFSSSWKDRLDGERLPATVSRVDRRVPVAVLNFAWHRLGWPPAEVLASGRFDVTHSPHPLMLPARRAARVVTIHDLNFLAHPERTRAEVRRDYPALARTHAHHADRVIVVSEFTAGEVERQLGVPRGRISVCPPGAPDWQPRDDRPAAGYVLFIGTLEPRKNLGALLDAVEMLIHSSASLPRPGGAAVPVHADVPELLVAGKATEDSRDWIDRMNRAPLKGVVRHVGYVDPSRTRELYAGARMLVVPSFEEGFGIPVLEAMTLGVPVVAARRGALPEVLGDAGQLVEPDRPEQIADAIARLLQDNAFAAACRARGIARARSYNWNATATAVFSAYQQAIEDHAHRG
jgi:glycosyltransferase involved in cell wall biosynthesis